MAKKIFYKQLKQQFEDKDIFVQISYNNENRIYSFDKIFSTILRKLADEIENCFLCRIDVDCVKKSFEIFDFDYAICSEIELDQFLKDFLREYNLNLIEK